MIHEPYSADRFTHWDPVRNVRAIASITCLATDRPASASDQGSCAILKWLVSGVV
ncbi:hypothetical protein FBY34_5866 [Streptomyces sp. SLBN-115]|nr:hypothetical protein FBY34_5866 [Streptomyces sp. SLBN-115]